jgi:hypothetical protein
MHQQIEKQTVVHISAPYISTTSRLTSVFQLHEVIDEKTEAEIMLCIVHT